MKDPKLYRIVLTGGSCGGKTTSLSHITDRLRSLGFNVYIVPEAATMLILGGVSLLGPDPSSVAFAQTKLLKLQLALEQTFTEITKTSGKDSVVIMDRGTMDSAAFVHPDMWQAILDENGWSLVGLRDKHYDAIIHLVTAAVGAEKFYTLENNAARTETIEQAAILDQKIQNAWLGHPHLRVIDNSSDFAGKINRVLRAVCNVVGVPAPIENERKFLISHHNGFGTVPVEHIDIEQTYLVAEKGEARVRKRGQHGSFTYTHTIKYKRTDYGFEDADIPINASIEIERMISSREYLDLLVKADQLKQPIKKKRSCFLWKNQYFELDMFISPRKGLCLLEAEMDDESTSLELPPFLTIEKEVTGDKKYSNTNLALG